MVITRRDPALSQGRAVQEGVTSWRRLKEKRRIPFNSSQDHNAKCMWPLKDYNADRRVTRRPEIACSLPAERFLAVAGNRLQ